MSKRVRWSLGLGAAGAIPAAFLSISILTATGGWLKAALCARLGAALGGEASIEGVSLSLWEGRAAVRGLRVSKGDALRVAAEDVRVKLQVVPLILFRSLRFEEVEIVRPDVSITEVAGAPKAAPPKVAIAIGSLRVSDGRVRYRYVRPGREPYVVTATNLQYAARDVDALTFQHLVYRAEIACELDLGTPARLVKGHGERSTLELTGVRLERVVDFLGQPEPIHVSDGVVSFRYAHAGGADADVSMDLRGVRIARGGGTFLLIPVDRIAEYVDRKERNVQLAFRARPFEMSDDLKEFTRELWKGMWETLKKRVAEEVTDTFKRATDAVIDLFKRDEK